MDLRRQAARDRPPQAARRNNKRVSAVEPDLVAPASRRRLRLPNQPRLKHGERTFLKFRSDRRRRRPGRLRFLDAIPRDGIWVCKHDQSGQDIIEPVTVVCSGVFLNHFGATASIELLKDGESLFKTDPFVLADPIDRGYLRYDPQDTQRVTLLPGSYLCRYWLDATIVASKPFKVTENHG